MWFFGAFFLKVELKVGNHVKKNYSRDVLSSGLVLKKVWVKNIFSRTFWNHSKIQSYLLFGPPNSYMSKFRHKFFSNSSESWDMCPILWQNDIHVGTTYSESLSAFAPTAGVLRMIFTWTSLVNIHIFLKNHRNIY